MTEQWQELKETITEMRDNNGTGTQQEVCKFLANLMEILEKQMQEPNGDLISRQAVIDACEQSINILEAVDRIMDLPSVKQEPKTGHWIEDNQRDLRICSICGRALPLIPRKDYYCPNCGAKNG